MPEERKVYRSPARAATKARPAQTAAPRPPQPPQKPKRRSAKRRRSRIVLGLCLLCLAVVLVVSVVMVRCTAEPGGPAEADFGTPAAAWQKNELGYYFNASGGAIPAAVLKGMDVSKFQGEVNWETAKAAGIDFAIIRCGFGGEWDGAEENWAQDDPQWRRNADECTRLGIPFGTYLYSYATTVEEARSEADHVARLLGLTAPTKGSFTIDGKQFPQDRIAILKEIGSFIEAPSFYANLTGRENLDIIRRILGLPKADVEDALELVGLTEFGDRLAKQYSLGMKQRLGLAGALLGRPPILILDEPTNGLDPSGIHEIRNLVKSLPSLYDCTVLISSHMLSEIELIADDIGILNHGRLLFEGSMNDLRQYALQSGFAADNLEDVFLSMVEKDNMDRKQRAKL